MTFPVSLEPLILKVPEKGVLRRVWAEKMSFPNSWASTSEQNLPVNRSDSFPIEAHVSEQLNAISTDAHRNNSLRAIGLPVVDTSIFEWRDQRGLPVFVPYLVQAKKVELHRFSVSHEYIDNLGISSLLIKHYLDVFKRTAYRWSYAPAEMGWDRAYIGCLFAIFFALVGSAMSLFLGLSIVELGIAVLISALFGFCIGLGLQVPLILVTVYNQIIPEQIKEMIKEREHHFRDISIVAEVVGWRFDRKGQPVYPERPALVIGYHDSTERWHLLGSFEATTLDSYLKAHFQI